MGVEVSGRGLRILFNWNDRVIFLLNFVSYVGSHKELNITRKRPRLVELTSVVDETENKRRQDLKEKEERNLKRLVAVVGATCGISRSLQSPEQGLENSFAENRSTGSGWYVRANGDSERGC